MSRTVLHYFLLINIALCLPSKKKLPDISTSVIQNDSTTVNISVVIQNLRIIDPLNLELQADILLTQKWFDPSLSADESTTIKAVAGQIWKPYIVVANGNDNNKCSKNSDTLFWRGYGEEGHIIFSEKLRTNVYCSLNLQTYPFDSQTCEIKFASFRFPQEELNLNWDQSPLELPNITELSEFKILNVSTDKQTDIRSSGKFSSVIVRLVIKRLPFHFIYFTVTPTALATTVSYIGNLIPLNIIVARYGINIFSLGFILILYSRLMCFFIVLNYLTALDKYFIVNIIFSLISISETILTDVVAQINDRRKQNVYYEIFLHFCKYYKMFCKIIYPLLYSVFLIVYFAYYMYY